MKTTLLTIAIAAGVLGAALQPGVASAADNTPGAAAAPKHGLKKIDTDGDGKISKAEAAARPKLAERFDAIDANKDGFITRDEMRAAHQKMAAAKFKSVDTNGDGRISRAEADANAPRLAKHFTEVDANKDGFVSKEELAAAKQKIAARR
jgi:Ca2+-binding EF-hand superfamily protein